jgi:hypothetical protein
VPKGHGYPSCPGEACSRFKENKYDLKKEGYFTVAFGHGHPLVCSKYPNYNPNNKKILINKT